MRESGSQVTLLQQREQERALEREKERAEQRCSEALKQLELRVQSLVEQGLLRMERSASGGLEVWVEQPGPKTGEPETHRPAHLSLIRSNILTA